MSMFARLMGTALNPQLWRRLEPVRAPVSSEMARRFCGPGAFFADRDGVRTVRNPNIQLLKLDTPA